MTEGDMIIVVDADSVYESIYRALAVVLLQ